MSDAESTSNEKMLYLVRLRRAFRRQEIEERDIVVFRPLLQGTFLSHKAARMFARNCPPVQVNPFAMENDLAVENGNIVIKHWFWVEDDGFEDEETEYDPDSAYVNPADSETPLSEFATLCREIGVRPPNFGDDADRSPNSFAQEDWQKKKDWQAKLTDPV